MRALLEIIHTPFIQPYWHLLLTICLISFLPYFIWTFYCWNKKIFELFVGILYLFYMLNVLVSRMISINKNKFDFDESSGKDKVTVKNETMDTIVFYILNDTAEPPKMIPPKKRTHYEFKVCLFFNIKSVLFHCNFLLLCQQIINKNKNC